MKRAFLINTAIAGALVLASQPAHAVNLPTPLTCHGKSETVGYAAIDYDAGTLTFLAGEGNRTINLTDASGSRATETSHELNATVRGQTIQIVHDSDKYRFKTPDNLTCEVSHLIAMPLTDALRVEPLIAPLAKVDEAVKDAAPEFDCYDPTDKSTCATIREGIVANGRGSFYTFGIGVILRCYEPGGSWTKYRVCSDNYSVRAETYNGSHWVLAQGDDSRCVQWGGPFSADYLACVAELPPNN